MHRLYMSSRLTPSNAAASFTVIHAGSVSNTISTSQCRVFPPRCMLGEWGAGDDFVVHRLRFQAPLPGILGGPDLQGGFLATSQADFLEVVIRGLKIDAAFLDQHGDSVAGYLHGE